MNKYNVKAIRSQLDNFAASRNWGAFRKRFIALLPSRLVPGWNDPDEALDGTASATFTPDTLDPSDKQKLELCRAVVEMKKSKNHRISSFSTESCPSLLHDLCMKFYSTTKLASSRHKYPPVPVDILEMVASVCSPKMFLTAWGKRRQTPLALLLDQNPPAYVVERLLTVMTTTRPQGSDTTALQQQHQPPILY